MGKKSTGSAIFPPASISYWKHYFVIFQDPEALLFVKGMRCKTDMLEYYWKREGTINNWRLFLFRALDKVKTLSCVKRLSNFAVIIAQNVVRSASWKQPALLF